MVAYLSLLISTYVIQSTKLQSIAWLSWGSLLWFGTARLYIQACYLVTSWTTLFRTFARACGLLSLFISILYYVLRVRFNNKYINEWSPSRVFIRPTFVFNICLYIIIYDLDDSICSKVLKVADGTKLVSIVSNANDIDRLQLDLRNLCNWSQNWQMI